MRAASLKYRLQLPGFELPEAERVYQQEFDDRSARMLEKMADTIESHTHVGESDRPPRQMAQASFTAEPQLLSAPPVRSFYTLLHSIDGLTTSLSEEIANEF
jgi:hypothetical protein